MSKEKKVKKIGKRSPIKRQPKIRVTVHNQTDGNKEEISLNLSDSTSDTIITQKMVEIPSITGVKQDIESEKIGNEIAVGKSPIIPELPADLIFCEWQLLRPASELQFSKALKTGTYPECQGCKSGQSQFRDPG
jgi:hypothetical protein